MKEIEASAHALKHPKFFSFITVSQCGLQYEEPDAEPIYLGPDADDETLGWSLRLAMSSSRTVDMKQLNRIINSKIVEKRGAERDAWAMKAYGFATKRALYREIDSCLVYIYDGQIEIQPTDRDSLYGARGTVADIIYVPVAASNEVLGAGLREGFRRCRRSFPG